MLLEFMAHMKLIFSYTSCLLLSSFCRMVLLLQGVSGGILTLLGYGM